MYISLRIRFGLIVFALAFASERASAAPPAGGTATSTPEATLSYKKPSSNGQFVFVMVGSDPERSGTLWSDERKTLSREIRRTYPRSGLYRNDGSVGPLWTIDWHALPSAVDVLPDGIHLVRTEPGGSTGEGAISFYASGRLLHSYRAVDLVDDHTQFDRIESQVTGWVKDTSYDEKKQQFTLTTLDGNTFVFDVQTGQVLSASRPGRLWRSIFLLTLAVVVSTVAISAAAQLVRHWRDRTSGVSVG